MPPKRPARHPSPPPTKRPALGGPSAWAAAVVLAIAIGAVYGRSFHAPFIFDDVDGIVNNESVTSLWPLVGPADHPGPLNPPPNLPSSGRPLVSFSLAANYYWGRLNPVGYHVFNVTIHFLTAILLWAIVRRTLRLPYFAARFNSSAGWLALATALVWALHPLQTEAVVYVTQRSELLMALFYLATLYCSMRYWASNNHRSRRAAWLSLATFASLAGMASKEVMVSAPVMVLLFERTFISGSWSSALRRSWPLYAGLAVTWLLLLALNIGAPRGNSAGFGLGLPLFSWWLTQFQVVLMYLKLVIWPSPLLIHYQLPYLTSIGQAWMYIVPVLLLAVVTVALLWRNQPAGYLLMGLFVILSPTSVVPILTEVAAERRMYLPLATIVVLFVVGGYVAVQWVVGSFVGAKQDIRVRQLPRLVTVATFVALMLLFGLVSAKRLRAYEDPVRLWREVAQIQPRNALAHGNLGSLLGKAGQLAEGIEELQIAVSLKPDDSTALSNLGHALSESGRSAEGIEKLRAALKLAPDDPAALINLGVALIQAGRFAEAVDPLQRAVRIKPSFAMAHNNLGGALSGIGKVPEAIEQFRQALNLDPDLVDAHQNLGVFLARSGDFQGAISHLEEAVRLQPQSAPAHGSLGQVLKQVGRSQDAIKHFRIAVRLQPDLWQTYADLARTLAAANQASEAIETAQKGIDLAHARGEPVVAEQLQQWLKQYQSDLGLNAPAAPLSQPQLKPQ